MNYLTLNGITFDAQVGIEKYHEEYNVLDGEGAGRSQARGSMIRDVIGAFPKYQITVFRKADNYAGLDSLWEFLKAHSCDDYINCDLADGQTVLKGRFYYSSFGRDLQQVVNGKNYWGDIEITLTSMEAAITP